MIKTLERFSSDVKLIPRTFCALGNMTIDCIIIIIIILFYIFIININYFLKKKKIDENNEKVVQCQGMDLTMKLMEKHWNNSDVYDYGCFLLQNLAITGNK